MFYFLFLVLSFLKCESLTIQSQVNSVEIVNGVSHAINLVTFQGTPADVGVPFTYYVTNPTTGAVADTVTINPLAPKSIYSWQPWSQAPQGVYPKIAQLMQVTAQGTNNLNAALSASYSYLNPTAFPSNLQLQRNHAPKTRSIQRMRVTEQRVKQPKQPSRKLLQVDPISVVAIGLSTAALIESTVALGEINSLGDKVNTISTTVNSLTTSVQGIQAFDNNVTAFENAQNQTNYGDQAQFAAANKQINILEQQSLSQSSLLGNVSQFVSSFYANTTTEFGQLTSQLLALNAQENTLWNFTVNFTNLLQSQITQIQTLLAAQVQQNFIQEITDYNNFIDLNLRRSLIANIQGILAGNDSLPSFPFVQDQGFAGLTYAQRVASNTQANALSAVTVRLMYTNLQSGQYIASELEVTLLVAIDWMLNYTLPDAPIEYILFNMGPSNCTAATTTQPWLCNLVVTVQINTCVQHNSTFNFPFQWNATRTLAASSQLGSLCVASPGYQSTTLVTFSSLNAWYAYYSAWYASNTFVLTTGNRIRVACDQTDSFIDMAVNPATTNVNDPSFMAQYTNPQFNLLPSYALYSMMAKGWQITLLTEQQDLEVAHNGRMASDIDSDKNPFNTRPDVNQTYDTSYQYWTRISNAIVNGYILEPIGTVNEIEVIINGNPSQTINNSYSIPSNNTAGYNITVTNVVSVDEAYSNQLPQTVIWFGDNPAVSGYVWDIPNSLVCEALAPGSCCRKINYIQRFNFSENVFSLTEFLEEHSMPIYEPKCAVESISEYGRLWVPATFGSSHYVCGDQLPLNGNIYQASSTTKPDFSICNVANFYQIEFDATNQQVTFEPVEAFTFTFTIQAPAGVYTTSIVSQCPTSYTINYTVSNGAYAIFNTTIVDPLAVTVVVSSDDSTCSGASPVGVQHYSASSPLVVHVIPCGNMYVNVFQVGSTVGCYPGGGLNLRVPQTSIQVALVPVQMVDYVSMIQDQIYASTIQQMLSERQLLVGIMSLVLQGVNTTAANTEFQNLVNTRAQSITNSSWANTAGNTTANYDQLVALTTAAQLQENLLNANFTVLQAYYSNITAAQLVLLGLISNITAAIIKQNAVNNATVSALKLLTNWSGDGFDFFASLGSELGAGASDIEGWAADGVQGLEGVVGFIVKTAAGIPGDILGGLLGAASGLLTLLGFVFAGLACAGCLYLYRRIEKLQDLLIGGQAARGEITEHPTMEPDTEAPNKKHVYKHVPPEEHDFVSVTPDTPHTPQAKGKNSFMKSVRI